MKLNKQDETKKRNNYRKWHLKICSHSKLTIAEKLLAVVQL